MHDLFIGIAPAQALGIRVNSFKDGRVELAAPAHAALLAEAGVSSDEAARVIRELETCGRSRITLRAAVHSGGTGCAAMTASYAVRSRKAEDGIEARV